MLRQAPFLAYYMLVFSVIGFVGPEGNLFLLQVTLSNTKFLMTLLAWNVFFTMSFFLCEFYVSCIIEKETSSFFKRPY